MKKSLLTSLLTRKPKFTKQTQLIVLKLSFCFLSLMIQNSVFGQTEIYVSDAGNFQNGPYQILKFDDTGANGKVFINDHLGWPQDIMIWEDKNELWISNFNFGNISIFNLETGAYISDFATNIGSPTRMKIGPDGYLYVLQWLGNGKVKRYRLDGTFIGDFTTTGVSNSIGMDWDHEGNLYVSSFDKGTIEKFDKQGINLGTFISGLAGPTNIFFDKDGNLVVLDYSAGRVKMFGKDGKFIKHFITGVPQCEGVSMLPNGNILLGVGGQKSIKMYSKDGVFISNIVPTGTLNLLTPNAVLTFTKTSSISDFTNFKEIFTSNIGHEYKINQELFGNSIVAIEILDLAGKIINKVDISNNYWSDLTMPEGIYFVRALTSDKKTYMQKIIYQK